MRRHKQKRGAAGLTHPFYISKRKTRAKCFFIIHQGERVRVVLKFAAPERAKTASAARLSLGDMCPLAGCKGVPFLKSRYRGWAKR